MFMHGLRVAIVVALGSVSALASAQQGCSSVLSSYGFYQQSGQTANAQAYAAEYPQCFGGSPTTSRTQINGTSFRQITANSNALAMRRLSAGSPPAVASLGIKGLAAGDQNGPWNVWGSAGDNSTRQSYSGRDVFGPFSIKNSNDVQTGILGVDYAASPSLTVGVSATTDRGNGSSQNGTLAPINMTNNGYIVAPYLGWQINKDFALDASAGVGSGDMTTSGNTTTKSNRSFAGVNLSYVRWMDNIQMTGKVGYLHGEENYGNSNTSGITNNGTSSKNKLGQARVDFQAGYWMSSFMPYAGLSYSSDTHRSTTQFGAPPDPIGKSAWVLTLGSNFFSLSSGITGGIAYNQEQGRSNQKNNNLVANISMRF